MNKNTSIGILVVIVIAAFGWFMFKDKFVNPPQTVEEDSSPSDNLEAKDPSESAVESTDSSIVNDPREFTITGSSFKFDIPEIKVKKGETVKITFKNAGGFHNFVIDEFNVATKQGNGPSQEIVTFVADKSGTFAYYCSVGQHRANGMEGKLIVE